MPSDRAASTPVVGGLRDAVRTFVAFMVAALFAFVLSKLGIVETEIDLVGLQEGITVIIVSAIMAFAGKAFRNKGKAIGKVI